MTQQTKTVEMVAAEVANVILGNALLPRDETRYKLLQQFATDQILRAINQAVADAVKGSGAVEALEKAMAREYVTNFHQLLSDPPLNASAWRMQQLSIKPALTALKTLELPDHAERGTKPVIGKGTKQI